jgi:hypothetical protein
LRAIKAARHRARPQSLVTHAGAPALIRRPFRPLLRLVLALYTVTALLLGSQHHGAGSPRTAEDVMAWLAGGGLLPSGCGETPQDPADAPPTHERCAACLLAQGSAPPPNPFCFAPPIVPAARPSLIGRLPTPPPAVLGARPPARAPPVLV